MITMTTLRWWAWQGPAHLRRGRGRTLCGETLDMRACYAITGQPRCAECERLGGARAEVDLLRACNEAMREPMRKLRDLTGMWAHGEDAVVDQVVAEVERLRERATAAEAREARLKQALRDLLMSADCTWEERREGHDWAEACEAARAALATPPPAASGDRCECGANDWETTATLIRCRGCGRVWGRVNGAWVQDPDTVPPAARGPDLQKPAASGESCPYCVGTASACGEYGPGGYTCTRPRGHDGDHIACASDEDEDERCVHVERWPQPAAAKQIVEARKP